MRTRVIILFPLITSASVTFNERPVLHEPSTLSQHSDYAWPDIANRRDERRREGERRRNRRRERRPSSPNYTSADEALHSLASKILIGCAWILHRRPTTKEEECIAFHSPPYEGRRLNVARSTAATKPPPPLA